MGRLARLGQELPPLPVIETGIIGAPLPGESEYYDYDSQFCKNYRAGTIQTFAPVYSCLVPTIAQLPPRPYYPPPPEEKDYTWLWALGGGFVFLVLVLKRR